MKLTDHMPANFPLLSVASLLPGIGISVKGYCVTINSKSSENVITRKGISVYPVPGTGNTINFAGIIDYKNNLALRNAGGNILFSTIVSKASVELPSLATGVYFVRVKNKVSGEATNLRSSKSK